MVICSVSDCGVNHKNNPENYTFHRIPLDSVVRGKWLTLIGRIGWNPRKYSSICSKHFPDHYKRKGRLKTILIKGALPILYVPGRLKDRVPSSYVCRDIPLTTQDQEISDPLTSRNKELVSKILSLKQKLRGKQKKIRCLVAKSKRQAFTIFKLQDVLKEIHLRRMGLKDHSEDISKRINTEFS